MTTLTNYVRNPVAKTNLTSITATGSSAISRVTGLAGTVATTGVQVVPDASLGFSGVEFACDVPPKGATVTSSFSITGSGTLDRAANVIVYYVEGGTSQANGTTLTLDATWQRATATLTLDPAKTPNAVAVRVFSGGAGTLGTCTVTGVLLHLGSTPRPFFESRLTLPDTVLTLGEPHIGPLRVGQKG